MFKKTCTSNPYHFRMRAQKIPAVHRGTAGMISFEEASTTPFYQRRAIVEATPVTLSPIVTATSASSGR